MILKKNCSLAKVQRGVLLISRGESLAIGSRKRLNRTRFFPRLNQKIEICSRDGPHVRDSFGCPKNPCAVSPGDKFPARTERKRNLHAAQPGLLSDLDRAYNPII